MLLKPVFSPKLKLGVALAAPKLNPPFCGVEADGVPNTPADVPPLVAAPYDGGLVSALPALKLNRLVFGAAPLELNPSPGLVLDGAPKLNTGALASGAVVGLSFGVKENVGVGLASPLPKANGLTAALLVAGAVVFGAGEKVNVALLVTPNADVLAPKVLPLAVAVAAAVVVATVALPLLTVPVLGLNGKLPAPKLNCGRLFSEPNVTGLLLVAPKENVELVTEVVTTVVAVTDLVPVPNEMVVAGTVAGVLMLPPNILVPGVLLNVLTGLLLVTVTAAVVITGAVVLVVNEKLGNAAVVVA